MEEDTEGTDKEQYSHLKPYQFKKGESGNPAGRPKGPSMKEWAREYLARLTPEERLDFMEGIPKAEIWKMSEGNPHSSTDAKVEVTVPKPLLDVLNNNSN